MVFWALKRWRRLATMGTRSLVGNPVAASAAIRLGNVEIVRRDDSSSSVGCHLKYVSLLVLVVQNASQVLLIRYARLRPDTDMFYATTAVFWTEVMKLITCITIVSAQERSLLRCFRLMFLQIVGQPWDTAKVCVPSLIYTVQNNLLYVAVSNLAAATFMVTYQLKILTTALFSVAMLRKPLSHAQWLALLLLFVGVSVVQLQEQNTVHSSSVSVNSTASSVAPSSRIQQSPMVGLTAVIVACLLSGFSGIYFEKILKGAAEVSVWMRNIQLAVLSIPISYVTMQAKDGAALSANGLFYGYDAVVWLIIIVYAVGGLTVAVVIKYADNILKGFATSVSIVVSCLVSVYLFNFQPSAQFVAGAALVMFSIYVYSKYPITITPKQRLAVLGNGNKSTDNTKSLLLPSTTDETE